MIYRPKPEGRRGGALQEHIWADAVPYLMRHGLEERHVRQIIGRWMGQYDHGDIREILSRCMNAANEPVHPTSYITKALENRKAETAPEVKDMDNARLLGKLRHMERFCANRNPDSHSHVLLRELRDEMERRNLV